MKVRDFTLEDISALLGWLEGTDRRFLVQFTGPKYRFPLDEVQLRSGMEGTEYRLFMVVQEDGSPVGHFQFIRLDQEKGETTIGRILLNPELRGKGMGTEMVREALRFGQERYGLRKFDLAVFGFNESAHGCYKKLGFQETGREEVCYDGIGETWVRISMTRELG